MPLPPGGLHTFQEVVTGPDEVPVEMVTSVPDPTSVLDRESIERERAALAAQAGLDDPGPTPHADDETEEAGAEPSRSAITADRGALLRLFSGLRGDSG